MFTFQELLETLKFENYICYNFMIISYAYNQSIAVEYNETRKIYLDKFNSWVKQNIIRLLYF